MGSGYAVHLSHRVRGGGHAVSRLVARRESVEGDARAIAEMRSVEPVGARRAAARREGAVAERRGHAQATRAEPDPSRGSGEARAGSTRAQTGFRLQRAPWKPAAARGGPIASGLWFLCRLGRRAPHELGLADGRRAARAARSACTVQAAARVTRGRACRAFRRKLPGASPLWRLKARLNANSDS